MSTEQIVVLVGLGAVFGALLLNAVRLTAAQAQASTASRPAAEPSSDPEYVAPICLNCKHFETRAAHEAMRRNPAFSRVMDTLSPYQHGRRSKVIDAGPCPDCDPNSNEGCMRCSGDRRIYRYEDVYPEDVPVHATWADYGWCTNKSFKRDRPFTELVQYGGSEICDGRHFELKPKMHLKVVA